MNCSCAQPESAVPYLGHSANDNGAGVPERLRDHLLAVAACAGRFAAAFGAEEQVRAAGLLHDLGKYADQFQRRLRKMGQVVVFKPQDGRKPYPPGYSEAGDDRRSKGREFRACPDLTQQEMVAAGAGCRPFLVDGVGVVTLLTKDDRIDDKLSAKHEFFVNLLADAASAVPVLSGIAAALRTDETLQAIRNDLAEHKAKPTELVTPAVADPSGRGPVAHDDDPLQELFEGFGLSVPDEAQEDAESRDSLVTQTRERPQAESCAARLLACLTKAERSHGPR